MISPSFLPVLTVQVLRTPYSTQDLREIEKSKSTQIVRHPPLTHYSVAPIPYPEARSTEILLRFRCGLSLLVHCYPVAADDSSRGHRVLYTLDTVHTHLLA